jgi:hypothetical protein
MWVLGPWSYFLGFGLGFGLGFCFLGLDSFLFFGSWS